MIVATTDSVQGARTEEVLGLVRGNVVRARNVFRDISALIRNIIGGELPEYSDLLRQTRDQATAQMAAQAESMGANAVVAVRYMTAMVASGAAEILVYGTAVRIATDDSPASSNGE